MLHLDNTQFDHILRWMLDLTQINGSSGNEHQVAIYLMNQLERLNSGTIKTKKLESHVNNNTTLSNYLATYETRNAKTRILFIAHMDTLPICIDPAPAMCTNRETIVSTNSSGLGSDDRAGCTVLLDIVRYCVDTNPNVTVGCLWTSSEEVGQLGMRYLTENLGDSYDFAIIVDGGKAKKITHGAFGKSILKVRAHGKPSHSSNRSHDCMNAIMVLSDFLNQIKAGSELSDNETGLYAKLNAYELSASSLPNVIPDIATAEVECRWADSISYKRLKSDIKTSIDCISKDPNVAIDTEYTIRYPNYIVSKNSELCKSLSFAIKSLGITPEYAISSGGTDANWANHHGLPAVGIGCGQRETHTANDYLNLADFREACEICRATVSLLSAS